jgi:hypothetical protein
MMLGASHPSSPGVRAMEQATVARFAGTGLAQRGIGPSIGPRWPDSPVPHATSCKDLRASRTEKIQQIQLHVTGRRAGVPVKRPPCALGGGGKNE